MVKAGPVAALAVLVSALVAVPAAGAVPPRFSKPITLGRQAIDSYVLRAEDVSGDGIPDLISTGNLEANAQSVRNLWATRRTLLCGWVRATGPFAPAARIGPPRASADGRQRHQRRRSA